MANNNNYFVKEYQTFLTTIIPSFSATENNTTKVTALRNKTADKFQKMSTLEPTLLRELINESEKIYKTLLNEQKINDGDYLTLSALTTFLMLTLQVDTSKERFQKHLQIIKNLFIFYYGVDNNEINESAEMIYEQIVMLLEKPYVPFSAQVTYRYYKRVLLGENRFINDTIRVYIAQSNATFSREWHVLENIVKPHMQQFCQEQFNVEFAFINLDYTLEETHENNFTNLYNVLLHAGELIEKAHPYFLLFTDTKYGKEINIDVINHICPHLDVNTPLSIAHLEYLLRANIPENNDSIFHFKREVKDNIETKLQTFINEVEANIPLDNCFTYNNMEELAKLITTNLKATIKQNISSSHVFEYSELKMIRQKDEVFGLREELQELFTEMNDQRYRLFLVHGETGVGKSMFLARLYDELVRQNHTVFPYVLQDFDLYRSEVHLLEYIRKKLEEHLSLRHEQFFSFQNTVTLVKKYAKMLEENEQFVILIDDIDLLIQDGELFSWFNNEFGGIRFVMTTTDANYFPKLTNKGIKKIELYGLKKEDANAFFAQKAKLAYKVLHPDVVEHLDLKFHFGRKYFNPLFLSLFVNQLLHLEAGALNKIITKKKRDSGATAQAIADYQSHLIDNSAMSLDELTKQKVNEFCKLHKNNRYLLSLLAFRALRGVTLSSFNDLLERLNSKQKHSTFLNLRPFLGELVEVTNYRYARITKPFVIKAIFEVVDKRTLQKVAYAIKDDITYDEFTRFKALVYTDKGLDEIINTYDEYNDFIDALILETLANHPNGIDYTLTFIDQVDLDINALAVIKQLYQHHLRINNQQPERGYIFLIKALEKIRVTTIIDSEHQRMLFDHYALFATMLIEALPRDKYAFYGNELIEFVRNNFDLFFLDSAPFFHFLTALTKFTEQFQDGAKLRDELFQTVIPHLTKVKTPFLETDLAILAFLYHIYKLEKNDPKYLDKYIELYDEHYKEEIKPISVHKQIEYLAFIIDALFDEKRINELIKFYMLLKKALHHDNILYPLKDELVAIHFEATKRASAAFLVQLRSVLYKETTNFKAQSEKYNDAIIFTSQLIYQPVFHAHNLFAAHKTVDNLHEITDSVLNYVTFHALIRHDFLHAIKQIIITSGLMLDLMENGIYDHTAYMLLLAYGQIYIDYRGDDVDLFDSADGYLKKIRLMQPKRLVYDFEKLTMATAAQCKLLQIEKSERLIRLEKKLNELNTFLSKL